VTSPLTKFYYDYILPLDLFAFLQKKGKTPSPSQDVGDREWFSQPRPGTDTTIETVTTTFKLPLSVSELTLEVLRTPCIVEVWYQDRSNNWRPVLDMTRVPVSVVVAWSQTKAYYKFHTKVYPIVAKQLQFRLTRINDTTMEGAPYVVGLRNTLIRRNVYDRSQGQQYLETDEDVLGNTVTKYIKDWDPNKANDDDPFTFWKSEPMPDPAAVCSLYLDVRGDDGGSKTIDKVYIDPVYTGQNLNLYFSNDDTRGTLKLNPIAVRPDEDENTTWRVNKGRTDVSTTLEDSYYRWTMSIGPQNGQDAWIGIEWTPDFTIDAGPPQNPVLYRAMNPIQGMWKPSVYYDSGAGEFVLRFDGSDGVGDPLDTREYRTAASSWLAGSTFRIVAGWDYATSTAHLSVVNQAGASIASLDAVVTDLPSRVTFDGQHELFKFRGTMTALILKLESYLVNSSGFQISPTYYVDPDPVIPDANGIVPSTTLDNAFYAVSWTTQEHGSGGSHITAYEDKEWTPIYRDYVTERGMLFFPQAIAMKYLKMEFTNLTEQPYPIYSSNIETRYRVYPVSIMQQSSLGPVLYTGQGGFLGMGTFISMNGVRSVNWLDPTSVMSAIGATLGTQYDPVAINQGSGYTSETLPNQGSTITNLQKTNRVEMGSSYVYKRDALQPYIMAQDAYVTTIKAEGLQKIAAYTDVPWDDIEAANPGAVTHVKSTGTLPIRGTDWWVYPGQQLKVPAAVMERLTGGGVVRERKLTREIRVRFQTTSVHRYDYKTITRDAAMAYFAGVREVIPFTSTFIPGEDKPYFDFPSYDPDQWVSTNTVDYGSLVGVDPSQPVQSSGGPITTSVRRFPINNRMFENSLSPWITDSNAWSWDGRQGHWILGTAKCTVDNLQHTLLSSSNQVTEGEQVDLKTAIKWQDLIVPENDAVAIRWGARYYNGADQIGEEALDEVSFSDWSTNTDGDWAVYTGTITIPASATSFRVFLQVTNKATSGTVWFDSVNATTPDTTVATVYKGLQTLSTFSKVAVDFKDSGLWKSDSMWADINPDSESISDTALAYYVDTVPESIPGGTWSDTIKDWAGDDVEWGTPFQVVSVSVDPNRRYLGKRVLHFRRDASSGGSTPEAGIKVMQWNHFVPKGLVRIGVQFRKEIANENNIVLRLRRLADGVEILQEIITNPATGRWVDHTTAFVEIPEGPDQEYEVMMTLEGDESDEVYLADLYCDIAQVRYFVRLGGVGSFLHEVTDLRYQDGRAYVTSTTPVNEVTVQAAILSSESWAYGMRLTPTYLK